MKLVLLTVAILFAPSEGKSRKSPLECFYFNSGASAAAGKRDVFCLDHDFLFGGVAVGKRFSPIPEPQDGVPPPYPPPPPAEGGLAPPPPPPPTSQPPAAKRSLDCQYYEASAAAGKRDIYCYDTDGIDYGYAVATRYSPSE
ncbi:DAZ-associated protein 1-like [Physella acuta]|uniref:DAZ-associated protein 1-like n=1 Tax=Physella acuta TaxID=109671 RepID=UPI0027DDEF02|nr:DAZ-associated protein 1-like [Physella acuta]